MLVISAVLVALWVAEYKVWYPAFGYFGPQKASFPIWTGPVPHSACIHTSLMCTSVTPGWALPAGLVIGIVGVLAAAFLYRPRPDRRGAQHA